jgi:hypothetical protein
MKNVEVLFAHQVRELFHSLEPFQDEKIIFQIRSYIIQNKEIFKAKAGSNGWDFWTRLRTVRVHFEVKKSRHQKAEDQKLTIKIKEVLLLSDS